MPNAQVGDLCYVSNKAKTPNLPGRIVEVIAKAKSGDKFISASGKEVVTLDTDDVCWVCKSANLLPWLVVETGEVIMFDQRAIDDSVLIPLRDNDEEDEMILIAGTPFEVS